jgi:hypothetical protein
MKPDPHRLRWYLPPLFGLVALALGQDINWDLHNYHYYIPYAFLTGRLDYDILPAQVANFYNPLLYVPFYYAVTLLPPLAVGFLIGTLQGLNFLLLEWIARLGGVTNAWLRLAIALLGLLGAGALSEFGTMFADTVLSLLVFAALGLALRAASSLHNAAALLAGVLAGAAAGFKQPMAVYAVGLCAAFLVLRLPFAVRLRLAFVFGLGTLAGITLSGGYWMHLLWQRYGNPLFPYFNEVFQSPWATAGDYRDERFIPESLSEALRFPFHFFTDYAQSAETYFRDLRLALVYVMLPVLAVHALFTRPLTAERTHAGRYLLAFGLAAYLVWLMLFAIYRYLIPLEMLAPLALWLIVARLFPAHRWRLGAGVALTVLLLTTTHHANWGRRDWTDRHFDITLPALTEPARTLVVMTGKAPTSYVIPSFPPGVRFVRIHSWFTGPSATRPPNRYDRLMQTLIAQHAGPLYHLYRKDEVYMSQPALAAHDLAEDHARCMTLVPGATRPKRAPLLFCPLQGMSNAHE